MDQHQKATRFGICVLLWAVLLRLTVTVDPGSAGVRQIVSRISPFLIYLETGRTVRFSPSSAVFSDFFRESPPPWNGEPESPELPEFAPEDLERVDMYYACSLRPELEELLLSPLAWDLKGENPAVLIVHTHTTESYTKNGEPYAEVSDYRTLDEDYNMVSIGDRVAQILESEGIRVIHDRQVHDYPSYNGSYVHTRKSTEALLAENPDIRLVLDLHRDASGSPGSQLRTQAQVDGQPSAQLMLVVGTDASGQSHDAWQENLALALKLHVVLQRRCSGIMRPLSLRSQRFNQDLSPGALIVEVGAAGNTHGEALAAAEALAGAIVELSRGSGGQE